MQIYEGNENYIFVSYAHKNGNIVLPIIDALCKSGFRVWYDHGIQAGTEWPAYIQDHLTACNRVLVFISPDSVASENCRNEINLASSLKKEMLIVYLEEAELLHGLALQLGSKQSLFRMNHDSDESFLRELLQAKVLQSCKDGEPSEAPDKFFSDIKIPKSESSKQKQESYDRTSTIKAHLDGEHMISRVGSICSNNPQQLWPHGTYSQVVDISKYSVVHFHAHLLRPTQKTQTLSVGIRIFDSTDALVFENITSVIFNEGDTRFSIGWVVKEESGFAQALGTYTAVIWLENSRAVEYTFQINTSKIGNDALPVPEKAKMEIDDLQRKLRHPGLFFYHLACWLVYLITIGTLGNDNVEAGMFLLLVSLAMTIIHCVMTSKTVTRKKGLAFLFSFPGSYFLGYYLLVMMIIVLVKRKDWKNRIEELKAYTE